jgi:hypothetical protein
LCFVEDALDLAGGDAGRVRYLSEEARACAEMIHELTLDKSFRVWLREGQANPLYQNEEGYAEGLPVRGMDQVRGVGCLV